MTFKRKLSSLKEQREIKKKRQDYCKKKEKRKDKSKIKDFWEALKLL
jgi:hypothetical protein